MTAQEQFEAWQENIATLDISKSYDLMALFRAITELNKITQLAEKEAK